MVPLAKYKSKSSSAIPFSYIYTLIVFLWFNCTHDHWGLRRNYLTLGSCLSCPAHQAVWSHSDSSQYLSHHFSSLIQSLNLLNTSCHLTSILPWARPSVSIPGPFLTANRDPLSCPDHAPPWSSQYRCLKWSTSQVPKSTPTLSSHRGLNTVHAWWKLSRNPHCQDHNWVSRCLPWVTPAGCTHSSYPPHLREHSRQSPSTPSHTKRLGVSGHGWEISAWRPALVLWCSCVGASSHITVTGRDWLSFPTLRSNYAFWS